MANSSEARYKTSDIARVLGVSTEYVRRQVNEGLLHASTRRLSHHRRVLRFTLDDVRAYDPDAALRLQQQDTGSAAA